MELIVFDLDGTLLNDRSQISTFTGETLQRLNAKGIAYTVATGRTLHSAQSMVANHGFRLPHIYSNGVIIWDPSAATLMLENLLTVGEAQHIADIISQQNVTPFITTIDSRQRSCIYHPSVRNDVEQRLVVEFNSRPGATLLDIKQLPDNAQITNISLLASTAVVDTIEQDIDTQSHLIAYSGPAIEGNGLKWMDIHHSQASKGGALNILKQRLGLSHIMCFGDSDNDLSMFAMANESYAMANAHSSVKAAANEIIGHHHEDGVAHFLRERFSL